MLCPEPKGIQLLLNIWILPILRKAQAINCNGSSPDTPLYIHCYKGHYDILYLYICHWNSTNCVATAPICMPTTIIISPQDPLFKDKIAVECQHHHAHTGVLYYYLRSSMIGPHYVLPTSVPCTSAFVIYFNNKLQSIHVPENPWI